MCFNDWRVGRLIRSQASVISVPTPAGQGIPANFQRVGLTIFTAAVPDVLGFKIQGQLGPSDIIEIDSTFLPWHITLATHGDLPTRAFTDFAFGAGGQAIVIVEYFAPEWLLRKGIEELYREYGQSGGP